MGLWMKKLVFLLTLAAAPAYAQQALPLTDWRASLDADLSKLSMPRDAHASIINILQAYERAAQAAKAKEPAQ
jgi:hypothetical protein